MENKGPFAKGGYVGTTAGRTSSMSFSYKIMTDTKWVEEQLDRFTYKPGWQFRVSNSIIGGPHLVITFECEDTYTPGSTIKVGSRHSLLFTPWAMGTDPDPDGFARWLSMILHDLEIHESREWLKRDGVIFDDPHAGQKRAR